MVRIFPLLFATLLSIGTLTASAQNQNGGNTLVCPTDDGSITIGNDYVALRDYVFRVERIDETGVIHLLDRTGKASAQLDVRSEQGLYFSVCEGKETMQLVALRSAIVQQADRSAQQPASSISSSDIFRERVNLVNLVRSGAYAGAIL